MRVSLRRQAARRSSRGSARRLAALPQGAPVVVLVHGYKFDPARPRIRPPPLAFRLRAGPRLRAHPQLAERASASPTTPASRASRVGFAWPASEPHLPSLLARRRTGFAIVYDRAGRFGTRLAALVALIQRLAPGRPVDLLAHSLGARVALAALPHLEAAPGRVILLGAAEFDARAREALDALTCPAPPQIYNVTARANDLYDFAFETFAPRRGRSERAVGRGLGVERPAWLDLQLDRPEVTAWVNDRGIRLRPPDSRLCHWGFYTRAARSPSTRRSCGAGRAGTSPRCAPCRPRGAGAALEPAAAGDRSLGAGGRPDGLRVTDAPGQRQAARDVIASARRRMPSRGKA